MTYKLDVDPASLVELKLTLSTIKGGAKVVLSRATNDAMSGIRTESVKIIGTKVTAKVAVIRKHFQIKKLTVSDLNGQIQCAGKPVPLISYSANPVKKGVSVKVLKSGGRTILKHTFIATMKSGHKGVFWRSFDQFRRPVKANFPYGVLPRKPYTLPIHELYGPRIPDILDDPDILQPVLINAEQRLHDRLNHHTNFLLEKAKK